MVPLAGAGAVYKKGTQHRRRERASERGREEGRVGTRQCSVGEERAASHNHFAFPLLPG